MREGKRLCGIGFGGVGFLSRGGLSEGAAAS